MPVGSNNRGINLSGSYWYIKGLDIKGAGDNGMNMSGSNNIIEFCSFYENSDTGLQIGGGASNNKLLIVILILMMIRDKVMPMDLQQSLM